MSTQDPKPATTDVQTDLDVEPDVQSDPALADSDEQSEWASEGGAAAEGPATDIDDNDE